MVAAAFRRDGYLRIAYEARLERWAAAAHATVLPALSNNTKEGPGWRCGGTWFVGVDALANDGAGTVAGVPLKGEAIDAAAQVFGGRLAQLHRAQVSVVRPGYPRPDPDERTAAHRYRHQRDAAHLDGLLPQGPQRRRRVAEPHGVVLGLPLNRCDAGASPMVVWAGSHEIMRHALTRALEGLSPQDWSRADITDAYQAARRAVFERCSRVVLHAPVGGGYLIHRLALHGMAPWQPGAMAPPEGRMIAYFRPQLESVQEWLTLP